jgi:metal-sulfur cluster biosynthetic enzyme
VIATLALIPDPPTPMQDTILEIELQEDGPPVIGATVAMTLTMPGCPMAPSYPALKDEGDGLYRVQTVVTMAGAWRADAKVASPGGQDMQFTFFFATR